MTTLASSPARSRMHRLARTILPLFVAITACAVVAGCAGTPHGADDAPESVSLEGTSWVLTRLGERSVLAGAPVTAEFDHGQVRGSDGCNRYSAPVTIAGSSLTVGPGGAMTLMACSPEVMDQAQAFMEALRAAQRYRIVDGRLDLFGSSGAIIATLTPQSTSILGTWKVIGYNNGREAFVGVLDEAPLDMTFAASNTVTGSSGCNQFTASWDRTDSAFHFGTAAATRRMCSGDGVMEQEQAFLAAMATVATVRLEGDSLEFRRGDGALALMLRRASDG